MQASGEKRTYQESSSTKKWLIGIYSFLVALDVLRLIGAITSSNGSSIGFGLINLVIDGIMLAAIIKKWRVVLNVGRIIIIIEIVLTAISIVIGAVAISKFDSIKGSISGGPFRSTVDEVTDLQKGMLIGAEVAFGIALICNILLVVLLGRYNTELENASYA